MVTSLSSSFIRFEIVSIPAMLFLFLYFSVIFSSLIYLTSFNSLTEKIHLHSCSWVENERLDVIHPSFRHFPRQQCFRNWQATVEIIYLPFWKILAVWFFHFVCFSLVVNELKLIVYWIILSQAPCLLSYCSFVSSKVLCVISVIFGLNILKKIWLGISDAAHFILHFQNCGYCLYWVTAAKSGAKGVYGHVYCVWGVAVLKFYLCN